MAMDRDDVVELKLEEQNELSFKVVVQGASNKPSLVRLVCEGPDMSYAFKGETEDDNTMCFRVPPMVKHLTAETTYNCAVEVMVEGRYFRPVQFPVVFKAEVKCVVENITVRQPQLKEEKISVVAVPTVVKRVAPAPQVQAPAPSPPTAPVTPTLRERSAVRRQAGATGIDNQVMEDVVRRLMAREKKNQSR